MEFTNPKDIAEAGERIYNEKYKTAFEAEHWDKFVGINVLTERAFVGDTASQALELARKEEPSGVFHLIKVGSLGAFRVSYSSNASLDWLFQ